MLGEYEEPGFEKEQNLRHYARRIADGSEDIYHCFGLETPKLDVSQIAKGTWSQNHEETLLPQVMAFALVVASGLFIAQGRNPFDAVQAIEDDVSHVIAHSGFDENVASVLVVTLFCRHAAARLRNPQAMIAIAALSCCNRITGADATADELKSFLQAIPDAPPETPMSRREFDQFRQDMRNELVKACPK